MSLVVRKRSSGFPTRSNTNWAVQPQKVTAKLICIFVFAYAKSRFSHDAAHIKPGSFIMH